MSPANLSTHDRLRREAAGLFSSRGYGGTSMAEIAQRVGVRKASLYNYYSSKQDLLLELLEDSLAAWEAASRPALGGEGSSEARLAAYLRATVRFAVENPQSVRIIRLAATQIGGSLGRKVKALLRRHEQESIGSLAEFFAAAVERGEIEGADAADLTLFWGVFVDGILINQVFGTAKAERYLARLPQLWDFFWRGVTGRAGGFERQP